MQFWSYVFFLATVFAVATVIVLKLVGMWLDERVDFFGLSVAVAMLYMTIQSVVGDTHSRALEAMGLGMYGILVFLSSALWGLEVVLILFLLDFLRDRWNMFWRGTDLV